MRSVHVLTAGAPDDGAPCTRRPVRERPRAVRRREAQPCRAWAARRRAAACRDDGMSTAEYAVGTIAAAALGTVLYQVLTSGAVSDALLGLVEQALDAQL
ncbi:DUF4244 domain-containing protein [Streptomyces sp. NPDC049881]|uniref:DUF4244 domain-containing protein n=1 Tax=Streptomyces sp. NPDC049881 TaxID=3155778 RepID=UPI003433AF96